VVGSTTTGSLNQHGCPSRLRVVALILSLHPEYTAEEVRRILWAGAMM